MPKRTIILILASSLALGDDSKRQQRLSSDKSSSLTQVRAATQRVLNDAVAAGRALARQASSTRKGRTVKSLSIEAFGLFAQGERQLLSSLDAASRGERAAASARAAKATAVVSRAAKALLRAGRLADEL
jgi:hypothetical protein